MTATRSGVKPTTRGVRVGRLDGLRGLAVLAVVVFHVETLLLTTRPGGGHIGVAIFFVLSGYLISHIVWHSNDTTWAGYGSFLRRRFTRLAPAMIGFIAIWGIVSAVIGIESIRSVVESAALAGTQTTAYYLAFGGTDHGWGPTWSLSVEWCFYLLWPLVILFLRRRGAHVLTASRLAVGLGMVLYAVALPLSTTQFYYLPLANLSVLFWGGALALLHISRSTTVDLDTAGRDPAIVLLGILLLVTLAAAPGDQGIGYRWLFLPASVAGALIVVDARPGTRGWADRFLELTPLRGVGLRAYSIYLWHVPVMYVMYKALPGRSPYMVAVLAMLALIPVVVTSFELLERPWLSSSGRVAATSGADPTGSGVTRSVAMARKPWVRL